MKALPSSQVGARALEIWNEFLGPEAKCPVNVDSKSHEATRLAMEKADRWTFDRAAVNIFFSSSFTFSLLADFCGWAFGDLILVSLFHSIFPPKNEKKMNAVFKKFNLIQKIQRT